MKTEQAKATSKHLSARSPPNLHADTLATMCGIGGVLRIYNPGESVPPHHESIPESWLDTLDESIKHRGPDGEGRFRDRAIRDDGTTVDIALVHRRLSIIDHAGGAQPMVHVRHPDGAGELLKPPPPLDPTHERALSVSDGPTADASAHPTEAHRSHSGLFPSDDRTIQPPHTIDATTLPQGTDLVAVAFNGCIYNHRELRSELEALGHRFETDHADTEVLIHGWRQHSHKLPEHLTSMHAFAIWNRANAELLMHRSSYGERPLYFGVGPRDGDFMLAFGSAVPGVRGVLRKATRESLPLNQLRTAEWIALGFGEPTTPFHEIYNIHPGSGFGNTQPTGKPRSRVQDIFNAWTGTDKAEDTDLPKRPMRSFALTTAKALKSRTLDAVDGILAEAVLQRLEADTPIACLLSGGIDSALITKYAHDAIGDLPAITVKMPDLRLDESESAAETARHLGVRHIIATPDTNAATDLVDLIESLGLPFGDSSLLPTYWACRAAAEHADVLLTGDGGDEMFTGYQRHMVPKYNSILGIIGSVPAWITPAGLLPGRDPSGKGERTRRFILAIRRQSYDSLLSIFPAPDAARLLGKTAHKPQWFSMPDSPFEAARFDRVFTLPGDYLRKVDTAAMRIPVETRAPFLDPRVAAAADRIGEHLTIGGRKFILRSLAERHLTTEIINRPKQGFAIPIGEWFRSDFGGLRQLLHDHLHSQDPFPGLADAGVEINTGFVDRMLREHDAAGERSINPWHGRDHSQRLYMLLVLSIWSRWLDRTRREAEQETLKTP